VGPHVIYYEVHDPIAVSADQLQVLDAAQRAVPVRPYGLDLRYEVPGKPGSVPPLPCSTRTAPVPS